ncbi:MAG: hypothetical protein A3B62_03275 [Rhodospirillales bacterium RIFCSPLOWO2_01_FULL_65_14]|nr:MAG: hypothetical protein A3B62_03275 [Rhodospirillales bacterium RIFCSPLOWO2_01_FULL_65_14]
MDPGIVILLIVGGVIALGIVIGLCMAAFTGAVFLFGFAAEQGFLGLAAYIACWVFFFPVMLIICIIVGIILLWVAHNSN